VEPPTSHSASVCAHPPTDAVVQGIGSLVLTVSHHTVITPHQLHKAVHCWSVRSWVRKYHNQSSTQPVYTALIRASHTDIWTQNLRFSEAGRAVPLSDCCWCPVSDQCKVHFTDYLQLVRLQAGPLVMGRL
jgi:hypothetical protein